MSRKLLSLFISGFFVIVLIIGYFLLYHKNDKDIDAFRAVPFDASLIIETDNLMRLVYALHDKSLIWKEFTETSRFKKFDNQLVFIYSFFW